MSTTLTEAINMYIEARQASRYSPHTLLDYQNTFRKFLRWLNHDPPVSQIGDDLIRGFLASCQDVSKKTALNYHIGLSSLWQWMCETNLVANNIVRQVKPPKPETREVIPYTRSEVNALLNAASEGRNFRRDRAIILLLLDTGIRSAELIGLRCKDISIQGGRMLVFGKGAKERALCFSGRTAAALEEYAAERHASPTYYRFFRSEGGSSLTQNGLRLAMARLGDRAGVLSVCVHRFHHTFAIEFLRNGGNIYALQRILGHTSLDMVKRYLAIIQADIETQMHRASPVERWEL